MSNHELSHAFLSLRGRLSRAVGKIVPPKDVEDIVQEAYVRLCQVETHPVKNVRSYLLKTVRNLALDYVKSARSRLSVPLEEGGDVFPEGAPTDETYAQAASNEELALFCEAVRYLPVQCRRAFVLRKVYGYSQSEIAIELGVAESTVEKHIALGMKRCTYFMLRHGAGPTSREESRTNKGGRRD
jgi:RNA polymerase sigma-70 factor (ECF subfamily)